MPVAAVVRRDGVDRRERRHHASRDRLLPDAEVNEPRHLAGREQFRQALLGAADAAHGAVETKQRVAISGGWFCRRCRPARA
jgi:hypothetical protein